MQETTLTWKGLWSSGAAWLEARADIGGASFPIAVRLCPKRPPPLIRI
jgi:hypothetical protein